MQSVRGLGRALALGIVFGAAVSSGAQAQLQTPITADQSNFQTSSVPLALGFEILNNATVSNTATPADPAFLVDDDIFTGISVTDGAIDADSTDAPATALEIAPGIDFLGGIENNDLISATAAGDNADVTAYAVRFRAGDTDFAGGIENTASGRIEALATSVGANDATAYGILIEPITGFVGTIDNQGVMDVQVSIEILIANTAIGGTYNLDPTLVEARGLQIEDTAVVGNIVNSGDSLDVVANNTLAYTVLWTGGTFSSSFTISQERTADARGMDLSGDLLVGSLRNDGALSATATAGFSADVSMTTAADGVSNMTTTLDAPTEEAGLNSVAVGIDAHYGTMGNPLGGVAFSNSSTIAATATSNLQADIDVTGGVSAAARYGSAGDAADARLTSSATGVSLGRTADDSSIFGDVVNEAGASIHATATASVDIDAAANGPQGESIVNVVASRVLAEALGLDVRTGTLAGNSLLSPTGDVINAGEIVAESSGTLQMTATTTGGSDAVVLADATAQSNALGGRIVVDTLLGNVVVEAGGLYAGHATATNAMTATAEFNAVAQGGGADAEGTGLLVAIGTMPGNVIVEGTVEGSATATSSATATATGDPENTATPATAEAYADDASATAEGLHLVVGLMTGTVLNSSSDTISARASLTQTAIASATSAANAFAEAHTDSTSTDDSTVVATGLSVTGEENSALVGGLANSGAIEASASYAQTATATSQGEQATSEAFGNEIEGTARGLYLGAETIGVVLNAPGGTISAETVGNTALTSSATGSTDSTTETAAGAIVVAFGSRSTAIGIAAGEEVATLTQLTNAASITARATGTTTETASASGPGIIGSGIEVGAVVHHAYGMDLNAATIALGVLNTGTIAATATTTHSATATTGAGIGGTALILQNSRFAEPPVEAWSDAIRISADQILAGGFVNRGTLTSHATTVDNRSATQSTDTTVAFGAGFNDTGLFAIRGTAIARGVAINTPGGLLNGGVLNAGAIDVAADLTMTETASHNSSADSGTCLEGISGNACTAFVQVDLTQAFILASGMDLATADPETFENIAVLSGGVRNEESIAATATGTVQLTSTASAADIAFSRVGNGFSTGARAFGMEVIFTQALTGGIANSDHIAATASLALTATSSASVTDGTPWVNSDDDDVASADTAVLLQTASSAAIGIFAGFDGDAEAAVLQGAVENLGRIDAVASLTATLGATATSGEANARAAAELTVPAQASATGISIDLWDDQDQNGAVLLDKVRNAAGAIIVATATSTVTDNASATGGTNAIAEVGSTLLSGRPLATARGIRIEGTTIEGVENAGQIAATATATRTATVKASGEEGFTTADADGINGSAEARGIAVLADTIEDGVDNSGVIQALAKSVVTATATLEGAAQSRARLQQGFSNASAGAIRIELDEGPLVGGFFNVGSLQSHAESSNNVTALSAFIEGGADGRSLVAIGGSGANAKGVYISVDDAALLDGVVNAAGAAISATALTTNSATLTESNPGVTTSAQASSSPATAISDGIDLEGVEDPFAVPLLISVLSGGVANHGSIESAATVTNTVLGQTQGGLMSISARTSRADAAAIDIAVSEALLGGISNSFLLRAASTYTQSITGTAGAGGYTIELGNGAVQSTARGIEFDADTADGSRLAGDVSNSEVIDVDAKATTTNTSTSLSAAGGSNEALITGVLTSAQGIDLDLLGAVFTPQEEPNPPLAEILGGTIEDDVINTLGALIDVSAAAAHSVTLVAPGNGEARLENRFVPDSPTTLGGETEAVGISIDALALDGSLINNGGIAATASGASTISLTAGGAGATDAQAVVLNQAIANERRIPTYRHRTTALGLFLLAEEVGGDLLNAGAMVVTAEQKNAMTLSAIGTGTVLVDGRDVAEAQAVGMRMKSLDIAGDFQNLAGGGISAKATATSTLQATAEGEFFDITGGGVANTAAAYAGGMDLQPDAASARALAKDDPDVFAPLAAIDTIRDPAAPGILSGLLANLGTIEAISTASASLTLTTGIVFEDPQLATLTDVGALAQGLGSSTEVIEGGAGNWGTIVATSSATATPDVDQENVRSFATVASLSYGMILVAPQLTENANTLLQIDPESIGRVGDADGDGIAVENHGLVQATATTVLDGGVGNPSVAAYASALQIGRDGEAFFVVVLNGVRPTRTEDLLGAGMTVEGDLVNTGTLTAKATAGSGGATAVGVGLYYSVVEGSLDNSGIIASDAIGSGAFSNGILVKQSIIQEGINTTGLVMATKTSAADSAFAAAINTVEAAGATVINVLDGIGENDQLSPEDNPLWTGDNLVGIIGDIRLADSFADIVNWSGGDIQGDIIGSSCAEICVFDIGGGADDVLNIFAGVADAFDYDGLITGLLAINVNTAEHAGTPVAFTFRGIVEQTVELNVNDNGTLIVGREYDGFFDAGLIAVGEYNHAAAGRVLFEIGDGSTTDEVGYITADGIVVDSAGALNIAGGLIGIQPTGTFWADQQTYEVIYAASRNGAFAGTYSPSPLLQVAVEYGDYDGEPGAGESGPGDVNDVTDFDSSDSDVRLTVTRVPFDEISGLTPNQKAVAGAIEDVFGPDLEGTEFGDGIAFLFLTDDYEEALSQLHGAEHAQTANLVGQLSGLFAQWLADRRSEQNGSQGAATQSYAWSPDLDQIAAARELADDADPQQTAEFARGGTRTAGSFSVWFGGGGLWGSADSDPSQDVQGFDQRTWGGMAGIDYQIDGQFLVGLAGLYQTTTAEFDDNGDSDVDSFQVGLYGTWDSGTLYVDALASVGWSSIDNRRKIVIPSVFEGTAKSDTDAFLLTMGAEVGYAFRFDGGFSVTPLAGIDYRHASIDGYKEHGASPYNLSVDETDVDSLTSTLGFAIGGDFDLGGMRLSPELRAAWQHEFLDSEQDITAAFVAEPGASFTAVGSDFGADAGLVGAGVTLAIQPGIEAFVDYNGRFSGGYTANAVSGGLRLSW